MGVARLLAKGWIVACLFAGAHALRMALAEGTASADAVEIGLCVVLFAAMGLLFIGGYGAAAPHGVPLGQRLKPHHLVPGFHETVFLIFVALSFVNQAVFAPADLSGPAVSALESAIAFAVPGQRALSGALSLCGLDGGRIFAAAFTWLLAIVYLCSSLSRIKLTAGILRLERATRPEVLGPSVVALVLGLAAVAGVQFLFVGTLFGLLGCSAFADIPGDLLIGLAPLMLAYLIVAALSALMASGPEK